MKTFQLIKQLCDMIDTKIDTSIQNAIDIYQSSHSDEPTRLDLNAISEKIKNLEERLSLSENKVEEQLPISPAKDEVAQRAVAQRTLVPDVSFSEIPEGVLDAALYDITYYVGAIRPLRYAGMTHVRDVIYKSDKELLRVKNFGLGKLHIVRKSIEDYIKQHEALSNIL